MRILVLSDTYPPVNRGGAGEVASLVADGLAARGHEILVVTTTGNAGALAGPSLESSGSGVPVTRPGAVTVATVSSPVISVARKHLSVLNPVAVAGVWHLARGFQPEAVHVHNVHERLSFGALLAARGGASKHRVPLVLTAHDYLLFCLTKFLCSRGNAAFRATPTACTHCQTIRRVPGRNAIVHGIVRRTVTTLACISRAQAMVMATNGFADIRTSVVHNGLDGAACQSLPGDGDAFRRRLDLDGRPIVLFGGRASGAKGGDQLVRAMAHVIRRVPAQLVVLGDRPEYFTVVRRIAAESGLPSGVVHDGGWLDVEGLREAHGAATVCAIPSVYPDPFNLMTLRAMLHERPVVGTCHGATPELVVDGVTGRIADPWDAEAFGTAIADVIANREKALTMGAAGRVRAIAEFSLDRQLAGYAQLLGVRERP
jgi:glycosyltransferase involved in cell wall biosynthesis